MIWQDEMQRDAVRIALPEWELRDDDQISVGFEHDDEMDGCGDGCCHFEPPAFTVVVHIQRAGNFPREYKSREYKDQEAASFLHKLMRRENAENISLLDAMTRIAKREALRDAAVQRASTDASIRDAGVVYERAMYYLSVGEEVRAQIHELVRSNDGFPASHGAR